MCFICNVRSDYNKDEIQLAEIGGFTYSFARFIIESANEHMKRHEEIVAVYDATNNIFNHIPDRDRNLPRRFFIEDLEEDFELTAEMLDARKTFLKDSK